MAIFNLPFGIVFIIFQVGDVGGDAEIKLVARRLIYPDLYILTNFFRFLGLIKLVLLFILLPLIFALAVFNYLGRVF